MTWLNTHEISAISTEETHIWLVDLDTTADQQLWLTPEELTRAHRFHQAIHQQRFINSRDLLRYLLGSYLATSPEKISLLPTDSGKLYVPDSMLQFNVAHCENYAIYAFTRDDSVGIDIEKKRPIKEIQGIIKRIASEEESKFMDQSNDIIEAFFQLWTRKEAVIKCSGEGLLAKLLDITTTTAQGQIQSPVIYPEHSDMYLVDIAVNDGFSAAFATTKIKTLKFFRFI